MSKLKVYLSNSNAEAYPVVRQVLSEFLKDIEYTNNYRAYDVAIDCQYINKDNIHLHKLEIINQIKNKINDKSNSFKQRGYI